MAKTPFQGFRLKEARVINPTSKQVDRAFHRYQTGPWGEKAEIQFEGQKYKVDIIDQSLAGLGLKCTGPVPIKVGQIIQVSNRDCNSRARVVFTKQESNNDTLLGLMLIIEKVAEHPIPKLPQMS